MQEHRTNEQEMRELTAEREMIVERTLSDGVLRRAVVRGSHYWFFSIFFNRHIRFETALFQRQMFYLTEMKSKLTVVMAFRGSGKSTIMNSSYALWAILGIQQKKFILIVSKTQSQAKNHLQNIRDELTENGLLKKDLGPFELDDTGWGLSSLVLPKIGARITAASREHPIRGIRFGPLRPDLIICDDVEDSASVKSGTDRDATYDWFMNEILTVGDDHTNVVVLGNLLHEFSLLMRLRTYIIRSQRTDMIFRAYPFLDDLEQVLWPSKYDTKKKVEEFAFSIPDEDLWNREYLLRYNETVSLADLRAEAEAEARGEVVEEIIFPLQTLGKYRISEPTWMSWNSEPGSEQRQKLLGISSVAKTDPSLAIFYLTQNIDSKRLIRWIAPLNRESPHNKELLRTIIQTGLRLGDEEAQQYAIELIGELVTAGHQEFKKLLKSSRAPLKS